ncbi:hypothetical protein HYN56_04835 [Flavobacterium crocinum]|uniref:Uncharacterized protein n=1 Tax=Flavobacterium crocinum TaxID=2183896 RepID=A0A2S1YHR4_9FLAO|nr:hypothetical protein HYN56_04835 [Flavobacterium crocinum]
MELIAVVVSSLFRKTYKTKHKASQRFLIFCEAFLFVKKTSFIIILKTFKGYTSILIVLFLNSFKNLYKNVRAR